MGTLLYHHPRLLSSVLVQSQLLTRTDTDEPPNTAFSESWLHRTAPPHRSEDGQNQSRPMEAAGPPGPRGCPEQSQRQLPGKAWRVLSCGVLVPGATMCLLLQVSASDRNHTPSPVQVHPKEMMAGVQRGCFPCPDSDTAGQSYSPHECRKRGFRAAQ